MFIFFGTRAPAIKTRRVEGTTVCPYCQTQNSFIATTFGRYFHIFWIPIFPLSKTTLLECTHCKKSYRANELPHDLAYALHQTDVLDPPKRPFWHGIGCLILLVLFFIPTFVGIIGLFILGNDDNDFRKLYLEADLKKVSTNPKLETDSISYYLADCMNHSIEGLRADSIRYYSKKEGSKLLVLLQADDLILTQRSTRKEVVFAIEDCLQESFAEEDLSVYIGVGNKNGLMMTKSPERENLRGSYASGRSLLPFYGEAPIVNED